MQLSFQGFTQQESNMQASNCPWCVCWIFQVTSSVVAQCFKAPMSSRLPSLAVPMWASQPCSIGWSSTVQLW